MNNSTINRPSPFITPCRRQVRPLPNSSATVKAQIQTTYLSKTNKQQKKRPFVGLALILTITSLGCEKPAQPISDSTTSPPSATPETMESAKSGNVSPPGGDTLDETKTKRQMIHRSQPEIAIRNAPRPDIDASELTPEQMFNSYCQACHSLKLVEDQRLNRDMWEWVMEDVVTEYGGAWITEDEQKILIDYLVENYGPQN